ncbi:hypothetical protein QL996_07180 [Planococcus sp. APC 4015]|nr:hypothetical protein [Planococcus sp. APC 4015]
MRDIDTPQPHGPLDPEILTASVAEIDGVRDIFPATASLTLAPQLIATIVTTAVDNPHRVDVLSDAAGEMITARIGIRRDTPAPHTATRVADALLAQIPEDADATVRIQISRIA